MFRYILTRIIIITYLLEVLLLPLLRLVADMVVKAGNYHFGIRCLILLISLSVICSVSVRVGVLRETQSITTLPTKNIRIAARSRGTSRYLLLPVSEGGGVHHALGDEVGHLVG